MLFWLLISSFQDSHSYLLFDRLDFSHSNKLCLRTCICVCYNGTHFIWNIFTVCMNNKCVVCVSLPHWTFTSCKFTEVDYIHVCCCFFLRSQNSDARVDGIGLKCIYLLEFFISTSIVCVWVCVCIHFSPALFVFLLIWTRFLVSSQLTWSYGYKRIWCDEFFIRKFFTLTFEFECKSVGKKKKWMEMGMEFDNFVFENVEIYLQSLSHSLSLWLPFNSSIVSGK